MHKSLYNFSKKRNKCEVTIKSTITKKNYQQGKKGLKQLKKKKLQKNQIWRERESIDLFAVNNLERIGERGGNEVK